MALAAGAIGGAIFYSLHIPLPWMLGSMIVVAIGAASGAPFKRSMTLRRVMLIMMGQLLGSFSAHSECHTTVTWRVF